jgi:hypothetical protein
MSGMAYADDQSYDAYRVHSAWEERRKSPVVVPKYRDPVQTDGRRVHRGIPGRFRGSGFAVVKIIFGQHITAAADGFYLVFVGGWVFEAFTLSSF